VKIKLTPANAPACCAETIRTYQAVVHGGKPRNWLQPGYRIALFCKPCQHGLEYTRANGWTRTLTEEDARTEKGAA
jgi:hypothetical protein